MRRVSQSQSMYQPGNKSVAVSKLMGNNSNVSGLQGKSMIAKGARKAQGNDLAKTTKSNFEQTIQNLKNKPNQKVLEDEYINGLQQEIKYLEYELKLLKDKEILEREGVNELDNFLKDQIPINENILAMKNKYNATKTKLEQQLSNLNMKKSQAEDVLQSQKNQIQRLHMIIDAHRKEKDSRRAEFKSKLEQIVKEITLTGDQYTGITDANRKMNEKIKKMNQQISIIQRQAEKERISQVRAFEQKTKKQQKLEEKYRLARETMIETTQKCEELSQLNDTNPLINPLEDQNSILRKKIMVNEKQKSTADNNIAEIQLFLKEQARERQLERQHKFKYLIAGDQNRSQIQLLERQAENIIKEQILRTKKVMIKDMNNELLQKEELYDLLTDRLRNLEQECTNLIQQKKEFQDFVQDQTKLQNELKNLIATTEGSITQSRSTADSLKRITQEIVGETVPIQDEFQKCKGRVPIVERQIERKNTTIHYLIKQVDLLKELKSLDLEQLQMISQGGSQMQNMLHSFIKNWEKIKSQ